MKFSIQRTRTVAAFEHLYPHTTHLHMHRNREINRPCRCVAMLYTTSNWTWSAIIYLSFSMAHFGIFIWHTDKVMLLCEFIRSFVHSFARSFNLFYFIHCFPFFYTSDLDRHWISNKTKSQAPNRFHSYFRCAK